MDAIVKGLTRVDVRARDGASRRWGARKAAVAGTGVAAAALCWASTAWACGLFAATPQAEVSPNRAPAATDVTVTGTNWQPDSAVALTLSTDGTKVVQPLGNAAVSADGRFSVRVHVADTEAGVYYVSAAQGPAHTNIPLELVGRGNGLPAPRWNAVAGGEAPGITSVNAHQADSGFPWTGALVVGGVLVLGGGLTAAEIRRQRARA